MFLVEICPLYTAYIYLENLGFRWHFRINFFVLGIFEMNTLVIYTIYNFCVWNYVPSFYLSQGLGIP